VDAGTKNADACCVDVAAVAVATLDNLGVACDDADSCSLGRVCHRVDNRGKLREGKAFLQNETCAEEFWLRARDGQIIDGAVHGKSSDGPAWEKEGLDHERVCAHGELARAEVKDRSVAKIFERRIAEGWKEEMLDEFVAEFAATTVAHDDGGITDQG
jgi:hypothetical protein